MRKDATLLIARLRGVTAVLLAVVIGIVSFSAVFARAAQASPIARLGIPVIVTSSGAKTGPVKMCHRMALPGGLNTCPLSGFSFGAVFGAVSEEQLPPISAATAWRLNDSALSAQRPGFGFFRPPRMSV